MTIYSVSLLFLFFTWNKLEIFKVCALMCDSNFIFKNAFPLNVHRLQRLHDQPKNMMSRSCPDSTIITPVPHMPPSLPTSYTSRNNNSHSEYHHHLLRHQQQQQSHQQPVSHTLNPPINIFPPPTFRRQSDSLPTRCLTPPPSPMPFDLFTPEKRNDDLVRIDITLVDKKRPEYVTKYNKTNR